MYSLFHFPDDFQEVIAPSLPSNLITEPTFVCPNNITVNTEPDVYFAHVFWTIPDIPPGYHVVSTHEPGDEFPVGLKTVHYYLSSDLGSSSLDCEFEVTVVGKFYEIFHSFQDVFRNTDSKS